MQISPKKEAIDHLDDRTAEEIIHRSIKSLLYKNSIPLDSLDRSPYKNTKDGGIEIALELPPGIKLLPFFNCTRTIMQVKAVQKMLSEEEIKEEFNKENILFFLGKDFSQESEWILVLTKAKASAGLKGIKFSTIETNINKWIKKTFNINVKFKIWERDNVYDLIKAAPNSWELIPGGESYQYLRSKTLATLINQNPKFKQNKGLDNEFIASPERIALLKRIKESLPITNHNFLDVRGMMGVGKTRICYESIIQSHLEDICLWSEGDELTTFDSIDRILSADLSTSILLFNDESNPASRKIIRRLKDAHGDRFQALIVIPFRGDNATSSNDDTVVIPNMADDELEKITQQYNFPDELTKQIVQTCKGFPKLVIALCDELVKKGKLNISSTGEIVELLKGVFYDPHTPERGWYRLILDDNERKIMGIIALAIEIGNLNENRVELEMLSKVFDIQLDELDFVIKKNIARGIIVQVVNFIYVTPIVLANYLAVSVLQQHKSKFSNLISSAAEIKRVNGGNTLLQSIADRIISCSYDEDIQEIANEALAGLTPNFFQAVLNNPNALEFVFKLGVIYPDYVLQSLKNYLEEADASFIKNSVEGRRNLVRFLEKAAFYSDLYNDAMDCLLVLSLNENEHWANNATGIFISFISPILSGTNASIEQKQKFIVSKILDNQKILNKDDLLKKIFHNSIYGNGMRSSGHENAFRKDFINTDNSYKASSRELNSHVDFLINYLSKRGNEKTKSIFFEEVAISLRKIGSRGFNIFTEELYDTILITFEGYINAYKALHSILKFDLSKITDEQKIFILKKLEDLATHNEETNLAILLNTYEYDRDPYYKSLKENIIKTIEHNPNFITKNIDLILKYPNHIRHFFYVIGFEINNDTLSAEVLKIINSKKEASLLSYVLALNNQGEEDKAYEMLTNIFESNTLPSSILIETYANLHSQNSIEKVFSILAKDPSLLKSIQHTNFSYALKKEDIIRIMTLCQNTPSILISFLSVERKNFEYDDIDYSTLIEMLVNLEMLGIDEWYINENFIPPLIINEKYLENFLTLFSKALDLIISDGDIKPEFHYAEYLNILLEKISEKYPNQTYAIFFDYFFTKQRVPYIATIHFKGWPSNIYQEEFNNIAKTKTVDECFIALYFLPNEHGVFTEFCAELIRRFPENKEVHDKIVSILFSTFDVIHGPLSVYYISLKKQLEEWGEANNLASNFIIESLLRMTEKAIQSEEKRENLSNYFSNRPV